MAKTTTMALRTLIFLALFCLLAVASAADEEVVHDLFAHLREIQAKSKGVLEELAKFNAERPEDLVQVGDGDDGGDIGEAVMLEGDAANDLMAHIRAYQKSIQAENAESEESEEMAEAEEDVAEVEDEDAMIGEEDGEGDTLVQGRLRQLEAALKSLTDKAVDSQGEFDSHSMQLNAKGARGSDVINLLHKYAQEMNQKLHGDRAGEELQWESGVSDKATFDRGEIGHGHKHDHDDHQHVQEHDHHHDHVHGHGLDRGHSHAHFSRASDVNYQEHDHSGHSHDHQHEERVGKGKFRLAEEIAEEEDLRQYGFEGQMYSSAKQPSRLGNPELGVWLRAMGCSLLVSLASLICLMLLPCIVSNGKPSERVVNTLACFGAGAMLGDAFLHQLPHAFGSCGTLPHSHDAHQHDHNHGHSHSHGHDQSQTAGHGHAHSLQDLATGLAVLGGILLFFLVEKIVRRYEELPSHGLTTALGHSHHHHNQRKEDDINEPEGYEKISEARKVTTVHKRSKGGKEIVAVDDAVSTAPLRSQQQIEASGGFVIGYLNLFSDAVHNFTDGMALGSAFLLHGSVGGWSRTLFLLAHELPQEVGDFGILVKSGFSVFEALAFNFLSALVALAGTAVALMLGGSSGHSSLIEGFIAGGFIYMSVGGVMPSMHEQGSSLSSTVSQLVPVMLGMGVAVAISLAE